MKTETCDRRSLYVGAPRGGGRLRVHVIVPCTCDLDLRVQMIVGVPGGVVYVYM